MMNQQKSIVEFTPCIDISELKGLSVGVMYIITFSRSNKCSLLWRGDVAEFEYDYKGAPVKVVFKINETPTGFGIRKWFVCNSCQKNTSKIYVSDGILACRSCQKLIYLSCARSGNEIRYLARKIRKLQFQLGFEGEIYEFPTFKPKNMHWSTFERMMKELRALQNERDQVWARSAVSALE